MSLHIDNPNRKELLHKFSRRPNRQFTPIETCKRFWEVKLFGQHLVGAYRHNRKNVDLGFQIYTDAR